MNKPKLTVFLDFDGVFITMCYESITAHQTEKENYQNVRRELYTNLKLENKGRDDIEAFRLDQVSKRNVHWINCLANDFDVDCVISSTHRSYLNTIEEQQYALDQAGIKFKAIGRTRRHNYKVEDDCRGTQIQEYVDQHNIGLYLILDDDSDFLPHQKEHHHPWCNSQDGFGHETLVKALLLTDKQLMRTVDGIQVVKLLSKGPVKIGETMYRIGTENYWYVSGYEAERIVCRDENGNTVGTSWLGVAFSEILNEFQSNKEE